MPFVTALKSFQEGRRPFGPDLPCTGFHRVLLRAEDGVLQFTLAPLPHPVECLAANVVPVTDNECADNRYLWVVRDQDVPFIKEHPAGGGASGSTVI